MLYLFAKSLYLFLEVDQMQQLCESCKNLIKLFGTNEYAVPWRCTCNATDNPDNQVKTVQTKINTDPFVWFSKDELKRWRKSRRSRGYSKSGRNRQ